VKSILQDWVMELPLREQGTLIVATRGCDTAPKFPLDSPERKLVAYIRGTVLVPFDEREVDRESGSFMSRIPPTDFKPSCVGHYPLHWVTHIMHALEVIGYRHPSLEIGGRCHLLYRDFCYSLHLRAESKQEMIVRLSEDRIAKGEVLL
jgi:hypothetical protein